MSFAKHKTNVFVDIKLSDAGRRLLSLGKLKFVKAIYSDREMNYKVGRIPSVYNLEDNWVLNSTYSTPTFSSITNFDGTEAVDLTNKIRYYNKSWTAETRGGMFMNMSAATPYEPYVATDLTLRIGRIRCQDMDGSDQLRINASGPWNRGPWLGNLVMVRYIPPVAVISSIDLIGTQTPLVSLWYRGIDQKTSSVFVPVDRQIPDFAGQTKAGSEMFSYPMSGISLYYGSGSSVSTVVWNMNIVRTSSEFGYMTGVTSAYTAYASIEYNGFKQYFGFDDHHRQVGFIHYTNAYTGKTFGDRFLERSMEITIPTLLWWRKPNYNPGCGDVGGHTFIDKQSPVLYDSIARSSYTLLKDGLDPNALVVGRVYQRLGMVVLTDPELLTALSYKSNRNWTLPPLELSFASQPMASASTLSTFGMCQSGKTYLVTYVAEYGGAYATYSGGVISYGYKPSMHCGYVQRIDYESDPSGRDKYLRATFPSRSFPYMRSSAGAVTYSGTGWMSNHINILVKEMATSAFTGIDNVESTGWTKLSGVGRWGAPTTAIDPYYAQAKQFVLTRDDYANGTQYELGEDFANTNLGTALLQEQELRVSGLTYGDEAFFFGDIKCTNVTDDHILNITLDMKSTEFNSSKNTTFDGRLDDSAYITEIGLFNEKGVMVGSAKPSYPIKKNYDRHVTIQLELIY